MEYSEQLDKIELDGVSINYRQTGSGSTNVVLVHGNFGSLQWWNKVMDHASDDYSFYALDLPGFGDSDKPDFDVSMEYYAGYVKKFVDKIDLNDIVLVGHSLGGAVVSCYAKDYSKDIKALRLIDAAPPSGYFTPQEHYPFLESLKDNPKLMKTALKATLAYSEDENLLNTLTTNALKMKSNLFTENARALGKYNYTDSLKSFKKPVWVVRGKDDTLITDEMAMETLNCFSNSYLSIYEYSSHTPFIEEAEKFYDDFNTFVDKCG